MQLLTCSDESRRMAEISCIGGRGAPSADVRESWNTDGRRGGGVIGCVRGHGRKAQERRRGSAGLQAAKSAHSPSLLTRFTLPSIIITHAHTCTHTHNQRHLHQNNRHPRHRHSFNPSFDSIRRSDSRKERINILAAKPRQLSTSPAAEGSLTRHPSTITPSHRPKPRQALGASETHRPGPIEWHSRHPPT